MPDSSDQPQPDQNETSDRSGGIDIEGDLSVTGDVAGRDIDKSVTVGYSAKAVQRLLITVGVLVFVTALCFFSGGVVLGAAVFNSLDRTVASSQVAADVFEEKLSIAQSITSGEEYEFEFTEEELSSYVRFSAGPRIGLSDGRARFVEPELVAIGGKLEALGDLRVAATFRLQEDSETPFALESVAVQVLPFEGSAFGWVTVPNVLVASFAEQVQEQLGSGYVVNQIDASSGTDTWSITVEGQ